jgi:hypothetical protein
VSWCTVFCHEFISCNFENDTFLPFLWYLIYFSYGIKEYLYYLWWIIPEFNTEFI